jgi:hypothetical protein
MGQKFSLEGPPGGRVELAPSIERRSVRIQAQWSSRYPHGFENSVIEIHKVGGGRAHDKSKSAKVGPGTDGTVVLNVDLYGQLTPGNDYYLKWKVEDNYPFSGRLLAESASFECVSLKLSAHAGDVDEEVEITCVRSVEERNAEGFRTAIDVDADGGGPSTAPAPKPPTEHSITFYKDGFTVDDGPLRKGDDPANAAFLAAVNQGQMPAELIGEDGAAEGDVHLIDKSGEVHLRPCVRGEGEGGQRLSCDRHWLPVPTRF